MATTSPAITSAHLSPPPPLSAAQATATQPLPSSSSPSLPSASQPNISSSSTPVAALAAASSSYSSTSPSANPTMEASKTRMPSRNPIPLSAAQEGEVRELYHKRVRKICDDQIREFAMCAKGRTVSMSWACREQKQAMQNCMIRYATLEEQDRAREEWFATRIDRARERAEKAARKRESDRKRREMYGLDENDRPIIKT